MIRNKYSDEFELAMEKYASSKTFDELLEISRTKFKYNINRNQLRKYLSRRKIRYKDFRPAVHKQTTALPSGTEYVKDDGMVLVKLGNGYWEYKQRYLYEQYHGVKLTNKDYIIFLDGDRTNFNIDNLKRVSNRVAGQFANIKLEAKSKEIIEAALISAELDVLIKEAEGVKPKSHKRKYGGMRYGKKS